jgi:hypothetical protein
MINRGSIPDPLLRAMKRASRKIHTEEAILITLYALSAIGMRRDHLSRPELLVRLGVDGPVFRCGQYLRLVQGRARGRMSRIIRAQILHWIGLLAAGSIYFCSSGQAVRL